MTHPTLTVVLPNYNHSRYLPQAIEAIAGQSRPPDELLILDDASTDNSVEIIESYAARYPFIRLLRNERNLGVVVSLSKLADAATGDYLYSGAADDFILPGFFEQAMAMAEEHPSAGVISGKMVAERPDGAEITVNQVRAWPQPICVTPAVYLRDYLYREHVTHSLASATIYRRDALEEVGRFLPEMGHWADNFAIHAIALKQGACYVPERWSTWRVMEDGFSRSQGTDPEATLQIAATGARLMRSEKFRDRFPEAYVRWWRNRVEREALNYYIWTLREPPGRSLMGLWKGRLLKRCLMLKVAMLYHGDAAAFIRADRQARR